MLLATTGVSGCGCVAGLGCGWLGWVIVVLCGVGAPDLSSLTSRIRGLFANLDLVGDSYGIKDDDCKVLFFRSTRLRARVLNFRRSRCTRQVRHFLGALFGLRHRPFLRLRPVERGVSRANCFAWSNSVSIECVDCVDFTVRERRIIFTG